jgi:hypothetical protein
LTPLLTPHKPTAIQNGETEADEGSASPFHLVTTPSVVLVIIASTEDSIIAAFRCNDSNSVLEMRNSFDESMSPLRDTATLVRIEK